MNPTTLTLVVCLVASLYSTTDGQVATWSPQQLQQLLQPAAQQQVPQSLQFNPALGMQLASPGAEPQRQLTAPDLQNQIQALGAQLAAANRQIQFYEQRLAGQQQQPAAAAGVESAPLNQPLGVQSQSQQQLPQLQQQLQQQMQLQAALAAQQQQLALQQQQQPQQFSPFGGQQVASQPQAQQQQQPQTAQFPSAPPQFQPAQPAAQQQAQVSSLVDNSANNQLASDPRLAGQPQFFSNQQAQQSQQLQLQLQQQQQLQLQQQQQQQQQQQPTTSSSVEPASIEPSLAAQQPTAPTSSQQPSRNDDKFSIGLGVLSPGYTQKFGNTELDFNQDKNGFSYTLSNNGHRNEPPPTPTTQKPATASADS